MAYIYCTNHTIFHKDKNKSKVVLNRNMKSDFFLLFESIVRL